MAIPVSSRLNSVQWRITRNVASICFTSITYKHNIAIIGMIAIITNPIQIFFHISFIFKLFLLNFVLLAFEPVRMNFRTAIGHLFVLLSHPRRQSRQKWWRHANWQRFFIWSRHIAHSFSYSSLNFFNLFRCVLLFSLDFYFDDWYFE